MSSSASPDATQSRPTQPAPLRAEALSFGSGPSLLDGLFPPGSITLLEGAPDNLTAALAVLALRDRPLAGHLHYAGADILALDRAEAGLWRRRNLRYLPRHPALPGTRTALGHLQTETREHEPQAAIPRALDLLDRFDLGRRAGTKTTALPPGAQQALSLATALCVLPRVLLLDDITADMAAPLAATVIRAIHHQSRKRGMIVIATSTDRALIDNADHRLVLR